MHWHPGYVQGAFLHICSITDLEVQMKKLLRNRTFLGVAGIILALVICFGAAPALNAAAGKEVSIVRIKQNVPKGARLTADMIQDVNVGSYNLPDSVLKSDSSVIGKYALTALQSGDYILSSKVSDKAPDIGLSNLDGKKQATSVTIKNFSDGLSGKLETGDVISLYVADYGDMKETISPPELQYVKLLAATTSTGVDNADGKKDSDSTKSQNDMPSTLTVLVTPLQAEKLVDYENNGHLHAALAYRGTEFNADKFLSLEDQYLAAQQAKTTSGGTSNGN